MINSLRAAANSMLSPRLDKLTISFRHLIFTTSKQRPISFKFAGSIAVFITYLWPKNGLVILSTEGVRASQLIVVKSDAFTFNLALPTS